MVVNTLRHLNFDNLQAARQVVPSAHSTGRPIRVMSTSQTQDMRRHTKNKSAFTGTHHPKSIYTAFGKRVLDITLALLMVPTILLVLLVSLPLVLMDGGPFFYRHPRVGRGGKMFGCLKIRTMRTDSAEQLARLLSTDPEAAREWAATQKLRHDPRITRFGHMLRKTSIDELPQLWNVLKGDMSLIGPRPVTAEEIERYGDAREDYMIVRPGITGLWQIAPERYDMTYAERVEVDVSYARTVSFLGDLRILWGTLLWALKPNGR
jgi:exopolysaccharide production protein ExoY